MTLASDMQILQGLIGGMLIGFSALLLFIGSGKIAGISGIVGNAVSRPKQSMWQWLFVAGLLGGSAIFLVVNGSLEATFPSFDGKTVLAAALVGVGTRIGSGCTSGHGVCGIGRGSARSIIATGIFISIAITTVALAGL